MRSDRKTALEYAMGDEDRGETLALPQLEQSPRVELGSLVISSRAAKGSSISSRRGSVTSARAIETRIFMPPDNWRGNERSKPSSPTSARAAAGFGPAAVGSRPNSRSGRRALAQHPCPGHQRRLLEDEAQMRRPSCPWRRDAALGAGKGRRSASSTVLLPQPDGPSRQEGAPGVTFRSGCRRARRCRCESFCRHGSSTVQSSTSGVAIASSPTSRRPLSPGSSRHASLRLQRHPDALTTKRRS